jgi:hypothetical protein
MSDQSLTRRDFILRVSALGAFATGSSALLAACGGGETQSGDETAAPAEAPEAGAPMAAASCDDLSGLSETERAQSEQMRQTLQYTSTSTIEGKHCSNCALYIAPEGGAACGGCRLFPGPVSPNGYCNSWAPAQG